MVKDCKCKNCGCDKREDFYRSFEERKPFIDEEGDGFIIRTFSKDTEPHLLKWHMDEEDREVTPIETNDWLFQFDNELPIKIDNKLRIPKGIFHRIIKGTTNLVLKIQK
jgi:hypothetical protein